VIYHVSRQKSDYSENPDPTGSLPLNFSSWTHTHTRAHTQSSGGLWWVKTHADLQCDRPAAPRRGGGNMSVNEVFVFRPFKLIALLCVFLALSLDVVALLSPSWVTADHFSLSLWESCSQSEARAPAEEAPWSCFSTLTSGKTRVFTHSFLGGGVFGLFALGVRMLSSERGLQGCSNLSDFFFFLKRELRFCRLNCNWLVLK